jgi:hypothetical protein
MNEIYSAIYQRLSDQLSIEIYDHVPQFKDDSDYPFIRLDPLEISSNDVDDKTGFSATIQIVGFSRYRGSKEVSNIADSVYNSLNRFNFPDTSNYGISGIEETLRKIIVQGDGLTRNSVQRYELNFEPLPV